MGGERAFLRRIYEDRFSCEHLPPQGEAQDAEGRHYHERWHFKILYCRTPKKAHSQTVEIEKQIHVEIVGHEKREKSLSQGEGRRNAVPRQVCH